MKKILLILISFLFLSSCNTLYKLTPSYWRFKSEFKKELELVQKILDNPEQLQEIIESSEFYDKSNFYMCGNSYGFFTEYFLSDNYSDPQIVGFRKINMVLGKTRQNRFENVKLIIIYKPEQNFEILFAFHESGNKTLLVEICTVTI